MNSWILGGQQERLASIFWCAVKHSIYYHVCEELGRWFDSLLASNDASIFNTCTIEWLISPLVLWQQDGTREPAQFIIIYRRLLLYPSINSTRSNHSQETVRRHGVWAVVLLLLLSEDGLLSLYKLFEYHFLSYLLFVSLCVLTTKKLPRCWFFQRCRYSNSIHSEIVRREQGDGPFWIPLSYLEGECPRIVHQENIIQILEEKARRSNNNNRRRDFQLTNCLCIFLDEKPRGVVVPYWVPMHYGTWSQYIVWSRRESGKVSIDCHLQPVGVATTTTATTIAQQQWGRKETNECEWNYIILLRVLCDAAILPTGVHCMTILLFYKSIVSIEKKENENIEWHV